MPLDVGRISLDVVYGRKTYPVRLVLPANSAGDALSLQHLTEELERQTGVPAHRQSIVVEGEVNSALKSEMIRRRPSTPLHVVGIRNRVSIHMYGDKLEPWNDEGWVKLQNMERKYGQWQQEMNRILHTMNLFRRQITKQPNASTAKELEKLATKLLNIRHEIHLLRMTMSQTDVVCEFNDCRARQLKLRLSSNMDKRLEEIEAVIFAVRQNDLNKASFLKSSFLHLKEC